MRHVFDAGDYDHNGLLTVPVEFWVAVVFFIRAWGTFCSRSGQRMALFDGLYVTDHLTQ